MVEELNHFQLLDFSPGSKAEDFRLSTRGLVGNVGLFIDSLPWVPLRSLLEGRCGLGAVCLRLIPHIWPWVGGSEEKAGVCWIIPSGRVLNTLAERGRNQGLRETLSLVLVLS